MYKYFYQGFGSLPAPPYKTNKQTHRALLSYMYLTLLHVTKLREIHIPYMKRVPYYLVEKELDITQMNGSSQVHSRSCVLYSIVKLNPVQGACYCAM